MRVTVDATPLLGQRTGIGRYVENLLAELPGALARRGLPAEVQATTWTWRGGEVTDLPPGVRQVGHRVPARVLRQLWRRVPFPSIESLAGRCDVVHGTNFVVPPSRRARQVVTVHDLTYLDWPETVAPASLAYHDLVARAVARGARVVCPSTAVADAVQQRYEIPADRVKVTPLGVGAEWFDHAAPTGRATDRPLPREYLLFVGSLDPRKNLQLLLRAHALLRQDDPSAPDLVLVGPAGRDDLAPQAGVHLTGYLSDADLRNVVVGARALVLPSLDEGFGLPVLEAFAMGTAVLAADISVLREVAGPHATFADATTAETLAAGLEQVLRIPDGDGHRAARRAWAGRFTWARCADLTVDAYLAA